VQNHYFTAGLVENQIIARRLQHQLLDDFVSICTACLKTLPHYLAAFIELEYIERREHRTPPILRAIVCTKFSYSGLYRIEHVLRSQPYVELDSNLVLGFDARFSGRFDTEVCLFHGALAYVMAVLQRDLH